MTSPPCPCPHTHGTFCLSQLNTVWMETGSGNMPAPRQAHACLPCLSSLSICMGGVSPGHLNLTNSLCIVLQREQKGHFEKRRKRRKKKAQLGGTEGEGVHPPLPGATAFPHPHHTPTCPRHCALYLGGDHLAKGKARTGTDTSGGGVACLILLSS